MLHKCALYAAIKLFITGSYVSPYQIFLVHYLYHPLKMTKTIFTGQDLRVSSMT